MFLSTLKSPMGAPTSHSVSRAAPFLRCPGSRSLHVDLPTSATAGGPGCWPPGRRCRADPQVRVRSFFPSLLKHRSPATLRLRRDARARSVQGEGCQNSIRPLTGGFSRERPDHRRSGPAQNLIRTRGSEIRGSIYGTPQDDLVFEEVAGIATRRAQRARRAARRGRGRSCCRLGRRWFRAQRVDSLRSRPRRRRQRARLVSRSWT